MNHTFKQFLTRDNSIVVNIKLKKYISNIPIDIFIKEYKISNFWKGKFFIKRLIIKIFKYQLNQKIKWNKNFWSKIKISKLKIEIDNQDIKNIQLNIKKKTTSSRYSDIKKYTKLIHENHEVGNPLYIKGSVMKFLGANVQSDDIFILDGSRRLIANIMNNKNPNILLIESK